MTTVPKQNPKCGTKSDGGPDSSITTDISLDKNSDTKVLIEYENDETLDIKEEIIQDQMTKEATAQKRNERYVSKLCTVDIIKDDILSVRNKLLSQEKKKIQESMEKKYKCEKCARSYRKKKDLNRHKKFECGIVPQFRCKFCKKQFRQRSYINRHIDRVHQKKNSATLKTRHYCDKCSLSYIWTKDLQRHKRLEHAAVKPLFTCDICGHTSKEKSNLSKHIRSYHLK